MLGVEDEIDRRSTRCSRCPAVAGDKVDVEQLVVVGAHCGCGAGSRRGRWNRADDGIVIGHETQVGSGSVRDVIEEGVDRCGQR